MNYASKIIVFPDNSVHIDGKRVYWDKKDFKRYGIELVRYSNSPSEDENGVQKIIGNTLIVIFPTIAHRNQSGRNKRKKIKRTNKNK